MLTCHKGVLSARLAIGLTRQERVEIVIIHIIHSGGENRSEWTAGLRQVSSGHRDSAAAVSLLIQEAGRFHSTVFKSRCGTDRVLLLDPLLVD